MTEPCTRERVLAVLHARDLGDLAEAVADLAGPAVAAVAHRDDHGCEACPVDGAYDPAQAGAIIAHQAVAGGLVYREHVCPACLAGAIRWTLATTGTLAAFWVEVPMNDAELAQVTAAPAVAA